MPDLPSRTRLEICVDTPEGLETAIAAGADRIELCAALDLGGLTPSPGLIAVARGAAIPIFAMIRPRAGSFVFGAHDRDVMLADIAAVRAAGLAGVVLGASRSDGGLDAETLALLCRAAAGLGRTLHRAFDLVADRPAALDLAASLGFERILTSGGALSAPEGRAALKALTHAARGRLSIMAGGGIRPDNVAEIVRHTGVPEVHASAKRAQVADPDLVRRGFAAAQSFVTDGETIRALRQAIDPAE